MKENDCSQCCLRQPNEESYQKANFRWPPDWECAFGCDNFPFHGWSCKEFVAEKAPPEPIAEDTTCTRCNYWSCGCLLLEITHEKCKESGNYRFFWKRSES